MERGKFLPILIAWACFPFSAPVLAEADIAAQAVAARLDPDGIQRANIVGGEYFFEPAHLRVRRNIPVELAITREAGAVPHSFVVEAPEAGIMVDVELGTAPTKVVFTPTAAGVYPYYCSKKLLFFKSHREKGMAGTLEVVP